MMAFEYNGAKIDNVSKQYKIWKARFYQIQQTGKADVIQETQLVLQEQKVFIKVIPNTFTNQLRNLTLS